jgi:hypothetical protein
MQKVDQAEATACQNSHFACSLRCCRKAHLVSKLKLSAVSSGSFAVEPLIEFFVALGDQTFLFFGKSVRYRDKSNEIVPLRNNASHPPDHSRALGRVGGRERWCRLSHSKPVYTTLPTGPALSTDCRGGLARAR